MKYVIYLRVSTDQQAQSGLGLEAQRDICLRYIKDGSKYVEFSDEGFSGALDIEKRPGLIAAIDAIERGDILLVAKRDRLGRDPIVNAMVERAIERKKGRIVSASGDVRDDNDPSSILMRRMVDAFAEYERLIIGARTKAALQVKKKRGQRIGHIPFGYRICTDNVHLEEDEREQKILKQMAELRKERATFREIAAKMNETQAFNRKDNAWNHVSIQRVIKNAKEAYT